MNASYGKGIVLVACLAVACTSAPERKPAPVTPSPAATAPQSSVAAGARPPACAKNFVAEVVGTTVWRLPGDTAIGFKSGMRIDANGAPRAYHKDDSKALASLANAGQDGDWRALVTDTGKPDGKPIAQGPGDPAPGFFVSPTALFDKNKPARSPARYVDASKIPYVALPDDAKEWGASLGDFAVVMNAKSGRITFAIFADIGPPAKLGEGSIALADALGIAASPRNGGMQSGVVYAIFTKSGNGKPRSIADIDREGQRLFDAFGGRAVLATCFR